MSEFEYNRDRSIRNWMKEDWNWMRSRDSDLIIPKTGVLKDTSEGKRRRAIRKTRENNHSKLECRSGNQTKFYLLLYHRRRSDLACMLVTIKLGSTENQPLSSASGTTIDWQGEFSRNDDLWSLAEEELERNRYVKYHRRFCWKTMEIVQLYESENDIQK